MQILRELEITWKVLWDLKTWWRRAGDYNVFRLHSWFWESFGFPLQCISLAKPLSFKYLVSTITNCLWNSQKFILLQQKLHLVREMDLIYGKRAPTAGTLIMPTWLSLYYLLKSPLHAGITWAAFKNCLCLEPTSDPTQTPEKIPGYGQWE